MAVKRTASRSWERTGDFAAATRRRLTVGPEGVSLRRGVTVADETGRSTQRDFETVAGQRQVKQVFQLETAAARRALVCPYVRGDREGAELEITVNGHAVRFAWPGKREYWEDSWQRLEVPAAALRAGANEVVLRAVGEGAWSLLLENCRWPDRSAVSDDGGRTWRREELGNNDRADGEYVVRLWLDQHESQGELCSEPVDLMALFALDGISPAGRPLSVAIAAAADTPPGTSVAIDWRAGTTPAYGPATWSAWQEIGAGGGELPAGARFGQWRLRLATADPAVTPVLKKVVLELEAEVEPADALRLGETDNPELVRSSWRFAHLPFGEPRGEALRRRWELDRVVGPAKTEFDAMVRLRQWVRERWEDGWNMGPLDYVPPWDAMVILELAGQQLSLGMCTHYATVLTQCCAALGFVARTQIMRAHCIVEVWSNDFGKWVSMDPGGDCNDATKFTYHFERGGIPQSALELNRAWRRQEYRDLVVSPTPPAATGDRFSVPNRLQLWERFMISLRNDELVTLEPGEPEHGKGSYAYDGYLFWADERTAALPWFSRHTDREGDLYWTPGRARIHLQAAGGGLQVLLDTEWPNLDRYEVRQDGGPWQARPAAFEWPLRAGANRLEVRPVNRYGRAGMTSRVTVSR
ncbi:MAG: transglutaminase-like domain-containing protein [Gemmatimonadota bacterium]